MSERVPRTINEGPSLRSIFSRLPKELQREIMERLSPKEALSLIESTSPDLLGVFRSIYPCEHGEIKSRELQRNVLRDCFAQ